jgi:CheY-like chemotaxis protein
MAKILVAASAVPRAIVERILSGHDLSCAETMVQAERFLREQNFDLIICTIMFDESKMFDFLQLAKSKPEWQHIPFVCARVSRRVLQSPTAMKTAAFTSRELGAEAVLDIKDYQAQADPERGMRDAIEKLLTLK